MIKLSSTALGEKVQGVPEINVFFFLYNFWRPTAGEADGRQNSKEERHGIFQTHWMKLRWKKRMIDNKELGCL